MLAEAFQTRKIWKGEHDAKTTVIIPAWERIHIPPIQEKYHPPSYLKRGDASSLEGITLEVSQTLRVCEKIFGFLVVFWVLPVQQHHQRLAQTAAAAAQHRGSNFVRSPCY